MYEELLDAVIGNDVERAEDLLRRGTPADPAGEGDSTALYRAATGGRTEIVRALLAAGADPDRLSGGADEGLPLCAAAAWGRTGAVEALLAAGADPAGRESHGWTAVLWAAANGHATTLETLLSAGAPAEDATDGGTTALTLAVRRGALGAVRALLAAGADPARPDGEGDTPLAIAYDWLGTQLESALLDQIADQVKEDSHVVVGRTRAEDGTDLVTVTVLDADGDPGFEVQCQRGHAAIATLLEEATGELPSFDELAERALPYRDLDEEAETWWTVAGSLQQRGDRETFEAAIRACAAEDPRRREFAVDVLSQFGFTEGGKPFLEESLPVLRRMAATEGDERVLRSVLGALGHHADPRALPEVLEIITSDDWTRTESDPAALAAVLPPGHADGLALLISMTEDPDDDVRDWATLSLAGLEQDTPQIREALAARLDDEDLTTVAEAARGLAARGDARARAGIERVLAESDDEYARDIVEGLRPLPG
ncbi:ankyrin repeat domain-containing protein [Planomonospora sp. ID67723]|uniref:ankyrin repeat domain-containing protein n=1 Tax=Planomonospora sp. ID67723 TaxID=2738134 RepID=UPI0018C43329|nr:ankyrin repeat domain-containing protein [Planomonospora sp. ID67723]MBG0830865.1 ankyrin repeat domain-containing protein [Planomonospora sp. ID67723]